jgi:hypothetical protein
LIHNNLKLKSYLKVFTLLIQKTIECGQ